MKAVVGRAYALNLIGLEASSVLVEAVLLGGLPNFTIVGLADTAVNEARERLRASFASISMAWPNERLTVNLSPADMVKTGTGFDLAIARAIFGALGYCRPLGKTALIGELGLDGCVHSVRGVMPSAMNAQRLGYQAIVVPQENEKEARLVPGIKVIGIEHIAQLALICGVTSAHYEEKNRETFSPRKKETAVSEDTYDMKDVYGQEEAIWGLEIAAVGGHHVQMVGAPGIGKSMLAQRFPGILPALNQEEAAEVAAIQSIRGMRINELPHIRPFSSPHHTCTTAALIGGGSGIAQPGAITFAHCGVLFCDEFPEFSSHAIQALREPMETGWVQLNRARSCVRYPARFQLIAAANPCRCGHAFDSDGSCVCKPHDRMVYSNKMGGPIRDRFDIRLILRRPTKAALAMGKQVSTSDLHQAVLEARERSEYRFFSGKFPAHIRTNAQLPGSWLRENTHVSDAMNTTFEKQIASGQLSLRGLDKVLKLSWSVADLHGHPLPTDDDIALAFILRGSRDVYGE